MLHGPDMGKIQVLSPRPPQRGKSNQNATQQTDQTTQNSAGHVLPPPPAPHLSNGFDKSY